MLHHTSTTKDKIKQFKRRHGIPVCQVKGCLESKQLMKSRHYTSADGSTTQYYICRAHAAERMRKYYRTPTGKAAILRSNIRQAEKALAALEAK